MLIYGCVDLKMEIKMRILDVLTNKSSSNLILYLTESEARELSSSLNELIRNSSNNHSHISSDDYQKELSVCLYDPNKLNGFNERSKKLIIDDI